MINLWAEQYSITSGINYCIVFTKCLPNTYHNQKTNSTMAKLIKFIGWGHVLTTMQTTVYWISLYSCTGCAWLTCAITFAMFVVCLKSMSSCSLQFQFQIERPAPTQWFPGWDGHSLSSHFYSTIFHHPLLFLQCTFWKIHVRINPGGKVFVCLFDCFFLSFKLHVNCLCSDDS